MGRRTRRWAGMFGLVGWLSLLAGPAVGTPVPPAAVVLPLQVGINLDGAPADPAGMARADALVATAGIGAVRIQLSWADVERSPGRYGFGDFDPVVAAAHRAGLAVVAILGLGNPLYSPEGAAIGSTPAAGGVPPFQVGGADLWPPTSSAPFAAYAHAVAVHYRGSIEAYEIWNEENEGWRFWPPHEDPPGYVRLLAAASRAVHSADPTAAVVSGGVFSPGVPPGLPGQTGVQFLGNCFTADPRLGVYLQGVAYHPYPYPFTSPDYNAPVRGSVYSVADGMRAVLTAQRDPRLPLWITEIGWPTSGGYGVSDTKQAEYLVRTLAYSSAQGVRHVIIYTYGDAADPTGADQEAHFGLIDAAGRPKPAYTAVASFTRQLNGTTSAATRHDVSGADTAVLAIGTRRRVTVLWNAPEGATTDQGPQPMAIKLTRAAVPLTPGWTARAYTMLGRPLPFSINGRVAYLPVGDAPIYLVEQPAKGTRSTLAGEDAGYGASVRLGLAASAAVLLLLGALALAAFQRLTTLRSYHSRAAGATSAT